MSALTGTLTSRRDISVENATVACMATFPPRYEKLPRVVESLAPQVDKLFIYANETLEGFPSFDYLGNVVVLDSNDYAGNISANGKILPIQFLNNCLVFTVDDDFTYPDDYVANYKAFFSCFDNRCCVTTHGSIFPRRLRWYYERDRIFAAQQPLENAQLVSLAGSGTFAFHQATLPVEVNEFLANVMVDLRLSLAAREHKLPIWCLPRPAGWLRHVGGEGLWHQYRQQITHHTLEARRHDWSFSHYREIARPALEIYRRKAAAGEIEFRLDPGLVRALECGEEPASWRDTWRTQMMRARYFAILEEEIDAAAG